MDSSEAGSLFIKISTTESEDAEGQKKRESKKGFGQAFADGIYIGTIVLISVLVTTAVSNAFESQTSSGLIFMLSFLAGMVYFCSKKIIEEIQDSRDAQCAQISAVRTAMVAVFKALEK